MEPFKNLLNPALVRTAGQHLHRVSRDFDRAGFERRALRGLQALEFKARAEHIADALEATLPAGFDQAAALLEASLAPARSRTEGLSHILPDEQGLAGWIIWPMSAYVARRGLAQPQRALQALHGMTQRFTCEWAVRPFIEHHRALTFETLRQWTQDPSEHVRRLVSEGSRPRLPWGLQLRALVQDPSPTLPLLLALQDDPSDYVRRSVANHLNDIAKDHPQVVVDWLSQHLPDAPDARRALLRHASRTLIKQGHPQVLNLWGHGAALAGVAGLAVQPQRLALGQSLELQVSLHSTSAQPQRLVIDYAVHHVKANGSLAPKVFKGWTLQLAPGESRELLKRHAVKPITTRRYHAGRHVVDLRVNGQICAEAEFALQLA